MSAGVPDRRLRIMFPASLQPGGAERQMLLLAQHLPRDRFDVSFVMLLEPTEMAREAERAGAAVHSLGAPRRAGQALPMYGVHQLNRVMSYAALCRRQRYDVVDAWLYLGYALAALTRPIARVPVLIAGRRSLSGFKSDFGIIERAIDGIARRSADIIVANSRAVADDVAEREGVDRSRIRVIRNGVESPPPVDNERRRSLRTTLGITDDGPVIGCVGSFRAGKGQILVVEAMASVRTSHPDAWLVFVGDGPERPAIERSARDAGLDQARFLGAVPDARSLYGAFDVLVSASEAEGLPNVVLEAAAAGRPIVATAAGGTPEIVIDGETGLTVPIGDTVALTRAILRILEDRDLGARLGAAARVHVARAFGIERFVAETAALYEEMVLRRA